MRKLSANYIFDGYQFLKNGILIIDENNTVIDLIDTKGNLEEAHGIEFYNGIITPGFVNAHCHIELSHLHGEIDQGSGLEKFVNGVVTKRKTFKEKIEVAIKRADIIMSSEGIVAVGDVSNTADSLNMKLKSKILYYTFFEILDLFRPEQTIESITNAESLYNSLNQLIPSSIVPHAPYSCSNEIFDFVKKINANKKSVISIHNQENKYEDEMFRNADGNLFHYFKKFSSGYNYFKPTGKSSLQSYIDLLPSESKYIFVHNTYSTSDDIKFAHSKLGSENCSWCLCPRSNWYIDRAQPDYSLFINNNCNIVVGTDSLASNTSLSIIDELRFIEQNISEIPLSSMLQWATINGAKALNIDSEKGSFEKSKTPGINLIESADLQNLKIGNASVKKLC